MDFGDGISLIPLTHLPAAARKPVSLFSVVALISGRSLG